VADFEFVQLLREAVETVARGRSLAFVRLVERRAAVGTPIPPLAGIERRVAPTQ